MKILAVDTATKSCSVAIIDNDTLLAEVTNVSAQTHSKHLMQMIDTAVALSGLKVSEMDGLAVTIGPGSFTGLRIGLSSIKGLALATGKPVVGISSLDALSVQSAAVFSTGLICSLLDAQKGEVYFARYRVKNGNLFKEIRERVLEPGKAVDDIREPCILIGSGAAVYRKVFTDRLGNFACFAPPLQNIIRASTIAQLGLERLKNNDHDEVDRLIPFYVRRSDAELKLGKKSTLAVG
jgi:tRNA threonylcarbamoyladenosine biosynthesis protein TsaB